MEVVFGLLKRTKFVNTFDINIFKRTCLEEMAKQLGLKTWQDWYNVHTGDYINTGGGNIHRNW